MTRPRTAWRAERLRLAQAAPRARSERSFRVARTPVPRVARHCRTTGLAGAASLRGAQTCRWNLRRHLAELPRRAMCRRRHPDVHGVGRAARGAARRDHLSRRADRHLQTRWKAEVPSPAALRAAGPLRAQPCVPAHGRGLFGRDRDRGRDSGRGAHDHAGLRRHGAAGDGDRSGRGRVADRSDCRDPQVRGVRGLRRMARCRPWLAPGPRRRTS